MIQPDYLPISLPDYQEQNPVLDYQPISLLDYAAGNRWFVPQEIRLQLKYNSSPRVIQKFARHVSEYNHEIERKAIDISNLIRIRPPQMRYLKFKKLYHMLMKKRAIYLKKERELSEMNPRMSLKYRRKANGIMCMLTTMFFDNVAYVYILEQEGRFDLLNVHFSRLPYGTSPRCGKLMSSFMQYYPFIRKSIRRASSVF